MQYHLFCDAEWKEPKTFEAMHALHLGEQVFLAESENEGKFYRIVNIEHGGVSHLEVKDLYIGGRIVLVTLVRIRQAELDAGTQPGCATN